LVNFTKEQQINYLDFLPEFNSIENPQSIYQDKIHLNLQGNQFVSEIIEKLLLYNFGNG